MHQMSLQAYWRLCWCCETNPESCSLRLHLVGRHATDRRRCTRMYLVDAPIVIQEAVAHEQQLQVWSPIAFLDCVWSGYCAPAQCANEARS